MSENLIRNRVSAFRKEFLPADPPPPEGYNTTAHALLYDFKGHYQSVVFTADQTIACLKAFLDIVPDLQEHLSGDNINVHTQASKLYALAWDDACELMLVYFSRTLKENTSDLVAYIHISKAVEKVEALVKVVDPEDQRIGIDSVKRLYSVYKTLKHIEENL